MFQTTNQYIPELEIMQANIWYVSEMLWAIKQTIGHLQYLKIEKHDWLPYSFLNQALCHRIALRGNKYRKPWIFPWEIWGLPVFFSLKPPPQWPADNPQWWLAIEDREPQVMLIRQDLLEHKIHITCRLRWTWIGKYIMTITTTMMII